MVPLLRRTSSLRCWETSCVFILLSTVSTRLKAGGQCVAIVQVKDLIEAGVHFGHRASRWNPKMRPYIYGKRNLIHIIDLRETVRGLLRAYKFLAKVASRGSLVVFVRPNRYAKEATNRGPAPATCLSPPQPGLRAPPPTSARI